MKKFIAILFLIYSISICRAEVTIEMEKEGDVFRIPCLVNGAKMKLVFDTGASVVSMSLPMAEYLLDNDYISKNDFRGSGKTTIADGKIVDHLRLNIKDIEIGGVHLSNVEAIVLASQNAPLLLGQSAIQKLGKIQLNQNILTILDINGATQNHRILTEDDDIDYLFNEAWNLYQNGLYSKAIEIYTLLNANNLLADFGKEVLSICYLGIHDYNNCIQTLNSMDELKYNWYALAYEGLKDRENALYYWIKQLDLTLENNDYAASGTAAQAIGSIYYDYGGTYAKHDYLKAIDYLKRCLLYYEKAYDLPKDAIWEQTIGNKPNEKVAFIRQEVGILDYVTYMIAQSEYEEARWTYDEWKRTLIGMARNKNKVARNACDSNYWHY